MKNSVWLWTAVGVFTGGFLGMTLLGLLGALIAGSVVGVLAYSGSKKNNGGPPAWLWKSKKKEDIKDQ